MLEAADVAADMSRYKLIQVTEAAVYVTAHPKGAYLVTPGELVSGRPPAVGRLPDLSRLQALFGRLDYQPDDHIVVLDDEGGGWAGRLGWTLDVIGHRTWSYLNGGLIAWIANGAAVEGGSPPGGSQGPVTLTLEQGPIAEIADVLAASESNNEVIWDVRSADEFVGNRSGSARAGHIPGAVHLDWLDLKNPANDMRLTDALESLLARAGVDAHRPIITHCQSHHRSGLSYMVGRILGYQIRAYHGSWSEWGNRDDLPVSSGP